MKDQFAVSDLRRLGVSTSVDVQPAEQEGNRFDDWTVESIATLLRWHFFCLRFLAPWSVCGSQNLWCHRWRCEEAEVCITRE